MNRVAEILKAERKALVDDLQRLKDQKQERKRLMDELDAQIVTAKAELDEIDADIAALPARLKPT